MPLLTDSATAIGVMARQPRAGRVKTRLARGIGDIAALDIYNSLLSRICQTVRRLDTSQYYKSLFVDPPEAVDFFRLMFPGFDTVRPQCEGDLGQRMQHAIGELLKETHVQKVILVGTDIPEIDARVLADTVRVLDHHDVAIGPTDDGGYYLIGMAMPYQELFEGPAWGTQSVLETTLQKARTKNLSVALLPELRDLDTAADLEYFKARGLFEV